MPVAFGCSMRIYSRPCPWLSKLECVTLRDMGSLVVRGEGGREFVFRSPIFLEEVLKVPRLQWADQMLISSCILESRGGLIFVTKSRGSQCSLQRVALEQQAGPGLLCCVFQLCCLLFFFSFIQAFEPQQLKLDLREERVSSHSIFG